MRHAGACIETMQQDLESPRTRHPKDGPQERGLEMLEGVGKDGFYLRMPLEDVMINIYQLY